MCCLRLVVVPEGDEVVVQPGHRRRADGHRDGEGDSDDGALRPTVPKDEAAQRVLRQAVEMQQQDHQCTTVMCFLSLGLQVPSLQ